MPESRQTRRVFVSSTFRDMHAERDHLVKVVFPELRERLDRYRVDFIDIDLRWGITEEQVEDGRVLPLCLQHIDEARPYFIGLLGQRYGWVPAELPEEATREYEWMREEQAKSITELEILHGVLQDESMHDRSFFYFRDPGALEPVPREVRHEVYEDTDPEQREKLRRLKERIRRSGLPVRRYHPEWDQEAPEGSTGIPGRFRGLEGFGETVLEDLWASIKDELALPETPPSERAATSLEREKDFQERFIDDRLRGVTDRIQREVRPELHERLMDYALGEVEAPVRPMMLVGAAGSGKSTALARLVRAVEEAIDDEGREDLLVLPHFTGASPRSTSLRASLARIVDTLGLAYGHEYDTSVELRELIGTFHDALEQGGPEARRLVLVIDAVNQFDDRDRAGRLLWLPTPVPANVRVVLSTIDSEQETTEAAEVARRRGYLLARAEPLNDRERRVITREVPAIAAKTLSDEQLTTLLANPATENPLFLRVALEELRGFGSFEDLDNKIDSFPHPRAVVDPVEAIFGQVLKRLEGDFDGALVRELMPLLGSARRGLAEREMRELLFGPDTEDTGDLYPVLRQLRPYLMRRGDVTDFFHDALGTAVRSRYLGHEDEQKKSHRKLADYFDQQDNFIGGVDAEERTPNARRVDELPFHLLRVGGHGRLAKQLQELTFVEAKAESGLVEDLAEEYREVLGELPESDPTRYVVGVLGRAISYDLSFLRGHPQCAFQVCWNRGWWYDAPEAAHYFAMDGSVSLYKPPWARSGPKLHELLERWRTERSESSPGEPWVRNLSPVIDLYASEQTVLGGHEGGVRHLAWSPPGDRLASASEDGTVRLWSPDGSDEALVLRGHEGRFKAVNHIAWSPSGDRVASASGDRTVRVWSRDGQVEPIVLRGHESWVWHVAWSPSGERLASASRDGTVRVWLLDSSGDPVVQPGDGGRLKVVKKVAWSPSGEWLAASTVIDLDHWVLVWPAGGLGKPFALRGVQHVAWSPSTEHERLATAHSDDHRVLLWSPDGSEPVELRGHVKSVQYIAWSPCGERLATASLDGTVRVWSADGAGEPVVLPGHSKGVRQVAWSPSGEWLATIEWAFEVRVRIWPADGSGEPWLLRSAEGDVKRIAWSPSGSHLASASGDGTIRVSSTTRPEEPVVPRREKAMVHEVSWSPSGERLASAWADGAVWISAVDGSEEPVVIAPEEEPQIQQLSWSPDSEWLAGGARWYETVRVWSADGVGVPIGLRGPGGQILHFAWSPSGGTLAIVSEGGTAIWDGDGSREPEVLRIHDEKSRLGHVSWSPSGDRLAIASERGTVIWFRWGPGRLEVLPKVATRVKHLLWSPSGDRLASVSRQGPVIWSTDGSGEVLVLRGHESGVLHLAWSPSGDRLASVSAAGTVRICSADGRGEPLVLLRRERRWSGRGDAKSEAADRRSARTRRKAAPRRPGVAWSRSGDRLASVSGDGTVRVWNAASGKELKRGSIASHGGWTVLASPTDIMTWAIKHSYSVRIVRLQED